MEKCKKHFRLIVIAIISISLDIYWKEFFFTVLFCYGLLINLFLTDIIKGKLRKILAVTIWTVFIAIFALGFYVNHYLPHGPSYPTGDVVCQNDDRGPCGEQYKEDLRYVNIPNWAKLLRSDEASLLLMGLALAGIILSSKKVE